MSNDSECVNSSEKEIYDRLQKLKEDNKEHSVNFTTDDIATRLQNLKGEIPSTSDAEIAARLANLKGLPTCEIASKVLYVKYKISLFFCTFMLLSCLYQGKQKKPSVKTIHFACTTTIKWCNVVLFLFIKALICK